ncbi:hypothetical protein HELRODRAFT_82139 [Helobdella robusta]|uniref:Serine protease HTRA2, mitochondrial n=1 Tax=Helobdella robusta TaxID=6412 RepID=T1G4N5_HELRO|nr:hypothetical protein HELRODRAFT_82139 [Helobdella robusta]ESO01410.1 hypothetical protein HELRODRAFT_82139 [Helobdella robusta]
MQPRYLHRKTSLNIKEPFWSKLKPYHLLTAGSALILCEAIRRSRWLSNVQAIEKVDVSNHHNSSSGKNAKHFNFIADVVEKAAPAVVYIEISGKLEHPFTGKTIAVSNGSGFIVRSDGLIITNAHVVGNSSKVKVRLNDGTQKIGLVQAVDSVSDLATIKISGENLPTIKLGKSGNLRPGEWVVAMGSPLQLSNTVTAGIISSANRKSHDLGLYNKDISYIQTDANINFGNSGGPLVNLEGEAIGINTMMVTTGISFAIPSDYANEFLNKAAQLEERCKRNKDISQIDNNDRYIGITMVTLTPDLLMTYKVQHRDLMHIDHGVLVYKVVIGSPAEIGGMKSGDIITEINGKSILTSDDVYRAIESGGEKLTVSIARGHSMLKISINPEIVN